MSDAINRIAKSCASSFYVFDSSELKRRVSYLRASLPPFAELCYAVKANPFIIRELEDLTERFEICSPGEAFICKALGIDSRSMVISGVYKTPSFIEELASDRNFEGIFTIESLSQYRLLCTLSEKYSRRFRVLPRLTNDSQFGMDESDIEMIISEQKQKSVLRGAALSDSVLSSEIQTDEKTCIAVQPDSVCQTAPALSAGGEPSDSVRTVRSADGGIADGGGTACGLDIIGIQFFSGTQKTSLKKYKRELEMLSAFLQRLREVYSFEAQELEYGTGFPVSYFRGGSLDEEALLKGFSELLENMPVRPRIVLELGRSIAASCGKYCTRVVDVKRNKGQRYALTDGGMHQIVYYGQYMAMKQPYVSVIHAAEENGGGAFTPADKLTENAPAGGITDPATETCGAGDSADGSCGGETLWTVCGALCSMNDIMVKQIPLPELETGDMLCFENAGAYCMTEGISLLLSRDLPAVFLVGENGEIYRLRAPFETRYLNLPQYEKI